jgi:hypothetical protein
LADSAAAAVDVEEVDGRLACPGALVVVVVVGLAAAGLAVVEEVDRRLDVVRLAAVVLDAAGLVVVLLARGEAAVPVEETGFRAAAVVDAVVDVAGLVVLAVVEVVLPGTTDCRRAGPLIEDVLFSLSDMEGRDLCVVVVPVVPAVAGFLTVPAGGRVGGCLRPLVGLVVALVVVVFAAAVPVVVGRRAPVVEEAPTFAFGEATLGGLEPFGALFFGVAWGEVVVPVPIVSSPDKTDSSRLTTSKLSDSDMLSSRDWEKASLSKNTSTYATR